MNDAALIEVADVTVTFGGVVALSEVSVALRPGRVFGLIGPNGAGKSTLFGVLAGSVRPAIGTVTYDGQRINRMPLYRRLREGIACSFQEVSCFGGLSVGAAVRIAASVKRDKGDHLDTLEMCGLAGVVDRPCGELTYGQQKLLGIAVALMSKPRVLLLDEPAAGISGEECDRVGAVVDSVRSQGLCIGLVDHNVAFVMGLSDEVCALDAGSVICTGSPAVVRADDGVIESYLGTSVG